MMARMNERVAVAAWTLGEDLRSRLPLAAALRGAHAAR